jgi:hypothetical protein
MRNFLALFVGVLSVSHSWAAQPLDQLLACRHVSDSASRLDCFDRASDAALTAKPTPVGEPPSEQATKPSPVSMAPFEHATIDSSIVRISRPPTGRAVFTLENGQVWQQMDAEDAKSAKVGDHVVVSKKILAAYWLKVDSGRSWRVTLIR